MDFDASPATRPMLATKEEEAAFIRSDEFVPFITACFAEGVRKAVEEEEAVKARVRKPE